MLSSFLGHVRKGMAGRAVHDRLVLVDASAAAHPGRLEPVAQERQQVTEPQPVRGTADTLPTLVSGNRSPGWWGIVFLLVIETVVVTSLIASYFYLKAYAPRWPPAGYEAPDLLLPFVSTGILFLSIVPMYWSLWAIRRDRRMQHMVAIAIVLVMGAVFLGMKVVEYSDKEYVWSTNAYGSIVWTMIGFHSAHLIAAMLKSLGTLIVAWFGFFNSRRYVSVQTNMMYWFFVVGIWIPLFLTIYISPHVM
jgi:cytochrome c oxidase subunit III